jgi:hypothetical protein
MCKDCLLMVLLIDALDDINLQIGSRGRLQALIESSKGNDGVPNGGNTMTLLKNKFRPKGRVVEA